MIHKRNKYYLISIFLTKCEGGHPYPIPAPTLSRSSFHAFNVVLVSCGHFRWLLDLILAKMWSVHYQCQWSAIDPRFFSYCVYARSHRQTRMLTRRPQNHNILVWSYNKPMDGLVIKKIVLSFGQKKKLYSGVKTRNPPPPRLVMKWDAPYINSSYATFIIH